MMNLLAADLRKIDMMSDNLENNRLIVNFFKSHTTLNAVLEEITKSKFGKAMNPVLSCTTRWLSDFFMLRRNVRLNPVLLSASVDQRINTECCKCQALSNLLQMRHSGNTLLG